MGRCVGRGKPFRLKAERVSRTKRQQLNYFHKLHHNLHASKFIGGIGLFSASNRADSICQVLDRRIAAQKLSCDVGKGTLSCSGPIMGWMITPRQWWLLRYEPSQPKPQVRGVRGGRREARSAQTQTDIVGRGGRIYPPGTAAAAEASGFWGGFYLKWNPRAGENAQVPSRRSAGGA